MELKYNIGDTLYFINDLHGGIDKVTINKIEITQDEIFYFEGYRYLPNYMIYKNIEEAKDVLIKLVTNEFNERIKRIKGLKDEQY